MYPVEIDGVQKNVVLIEAYLKNVGNQAIDVPLGTSLAIETKRVVEFYTTLMQQGIFLANLYESQIIL